MSPTRRGVSAERSAVQLQARRRVGLSILHRCPCGGIDSCNGMLNQAAGAAVSDLGCGTAGLEGGLRWTLWLPAPDGRAPEDTRR
jgi:hypothetical protein